MDGFFANHKVLTLTKRESYIRQYDEGVVSACSSDSLRPDLYDVIRGEYTTSGPRTSARSSMPAYSNAPAKGVASRTRSKRSSSAGTRKIPAVEYADVMFPFLEEDERESHVRLREGTKRMQELLIPAYLTAYSREKSVHRRFEVSKEKNHYLICVGLYGPEFTHLLNSFIMINVRTRWALWLIWRGSRTGPSDEALCLDYLDDCEKLALVRGTLNLDAFKDFAKQEHVRITDATAREALIAKSDCNEFLFAAFTIAYAFSQNSDSELRSWAQRIERSLGPDAMKDGFAITARMKINSNYYTTGWTSFTTRSTALFTLDRNRTDLVRVVAGVDRSVGIFARTVRKIRSTQDVLSTVMYHAGYFRFEPGQSSRSHTDFNCDKSASLATFPPLLDAMLRKGKMTRKRTLSAERMPHDAATQVIVRSMQRYFESNIVDACVSQYAKIAHCIRTVETLRIELFEKEMFFPDYVCMVPHRVSAKDFQTPTGERNSNGDCEAAIEFVMNGFMTDEIYTSASESDACSNLAPSKFPARTGSHAKKPPLVE